MAILYRPANKKVPDKNIMLTFGANLFIVKLG